MKTLIPDSGDNYYNGMYTSRGIMVVDHAIATTDQIGSTDSALTEREQVCFTAHASTDGFRASSRRLGFSAVRVGFAPIMSGVSTRLLSRPRFTRAGDGCESVRFRAVTEVAKMRHAVSAAVYDVSMQVRHDEREGWYVSEHQIEVEQVYTDVSGDQIHHLDGVRARNAVAHHDLYSVADAASLSVFVMVDRRVLTPMVVSRRGVQTVSGQVF